MFTPYLRSRDFPEANWAIIPLETSSLQNSFIVLLPTPAKRRSFRVLRDRSGRKENKSDNNVRLGSSFVVMKIIIFQQKRMKIYFFMKLRWTADNGFHLVLSFRGIYGRLSINRTIWRYFEILKFPNSLWKKSESVVWGSIYPVIMLWDLNLNRVLPFDTWMKDNECFCHVHNNSVLPACIWKPLKK